MNKKLHIISLDIPYPPDYGGMIDVFYKLKALYEAGIEITLHCFQYGNRMPADELLQYCKTVYYYRRKTGIRGLHFSLPYILSSRIDESLLVNLLEDESPILFEGLHSTFYLNHLLLKDRIKLLRAHNVESDYYKQLANNSGSFLKKLYYYFESNRLLTYENGLKNLSAILAISRADEIYFSKKYPDTNVQYIPAFHAIESMTSIAGKGTYCLYHGNLNVAENIKSVIYLAKEVFNTLTIPLLIAGKNPAREIKNLANEHIKIIADPDEGGMQLLIQNAHIHVLPAFQHTGIKLKLLHALFAGRFCITNDDTLEQPLPNHVSIAKNAEDFKHQILHLMQEEFMQQDIETRKELFKSYTNASGAKKIIELL